MCIMAIAWSNQSFRQGKYGTIIGTQPCEDPVFKIPRSIHNDLDAFLDEVIEDLPNDDFLKRIGLNGNLTVQGILDIIKRSFLQQKG